MRRETRLVQLLWPPTLAPKRRRKDGARRTFLVMAMVFGLAAATLRGQDVTLHVNVKLVRQGRQTPAERLAALRQEDEASARAK